MRTFLSSFLVFLLIISCGQKKEKIDKSLFSEIGEGMNVENILSENEAAEIYSDLSLKDTSEIKLIATVNSVCKVKGCWMRLELEEKEIMVKFKDYGFFMPTDIEGKQVVINGKAFVEEQSVEDQRHYAEDAGKSEEEILKINEPVRTLSFVADGVLLEK